MLTSNIYISQGLVNGVMGYVEHVDINPENDLPRTIYVKFDDESVGKRIQIKENRNAIPIETLQSEFHYGMRVIKREQFLLQPCWGCNIHKLQGTTLERAVVSIGSRVFVKGMSYVALSRVKTLVGLYIKLDASKIEAPVVVLEEYSGLANKAQAP